MTISFYIKTPTACRGTDLNIGNSNAAELFAWIGLDAELWNGDQFLASDITPLCMRRLWDIERNHDPEIPAHQYGRVIYNGRRPGYLRGRTQQLLDVCKRAVSLHPEALIYWG